MDSANVPCGNGTFYNCTRNGSCLPCDESQDELLSAYAKIRIIIYGLTFILSLLGNGCVMLVTLRKSVKGETITAFKLLITHLAFVDFLFSCNIFVLIPNELFNAEADDALPMCTFKRLLRQVPMEASVGTIAVIAIERYLGIARDFQAKKWTLKRALFSILLIWIISSGVYLPSTLSIQTTRGDRDCQEVMSPTNRKLIAVYLLVAEYVLPISIMAFCNYKIIRVIKTRATRLAGLGADENDQRYKEQRDTCRILIAIVIGYAMIALPNQIFFIYLDLGEKHESFSEAWDALQLLGVLLLVHSIFNPIIYSVMDEKFRDDVRHMCCCCCHSLGIGPRSRSSTVNTTSSQNHAERYAMVAAV